MEINVSKNILFTSISTIVQAVLTLFFWFLVARIAGADAMGITNAIVSFVTIVVTIDVLNTHLGMKRYLGIAKSLENVGQFKLIVVLTIVFVSLMVVISALIIALPSVKILDLMGISRTYTWIVISLIPALAFNIIFPEVLIAAKQSKDLATAVLIGSLARFPILFGCIHVLNISVTLGTIIAYSSYFFITSFISIIYLRNIFLQGRIRFANMRSDLQQIIEGGIASWIPTMVSVFGSQLGIITVYVAGGASEAGKFYLPLTIFTVALFIVNSINRVSHPLMAGMDTEQEQINFLSYSMKVAYIFTLPLAVAILFFSGSYLEVIGNEFTSAGSTLTILMLALPLAIVTEMVYYFAYARGDKQAVLYLGLIGNVPRIVLYFVLVPVFGTNGAALGYVIGGIAQLIFSLKTIHKYSHTMKYGSYLLITLIPFAIGALVWLINIHFLISTVIIFIGSLFAFVRLHQLTEFELRRFLYTTLPTSVAKKIYPFLSKIIQKIS